MNEIWGDFTRARTTHSLALLVSVVKFESERYLPSLPIFISTCISFNVSSPQSSISKLIVFVVLVTCVRWENWADCKKNSVVLFILFSRVRELHELVETTKKSAQVSFPVYLLILKTACGVRLYKTVYYMEESVLLGTKLLVDSIRHFIRDPSGVFFRMSPLWVSYRSMKSRFPPFAFVELVSPYNKKNITRWLEDMNFMFSRQEQYLTRSWISSIYYPAQARLITHTAVLYLQVCGVDDILN